MTSPRWIAVVVCALMLTACGLKSNSGGGAGGSSGGVGGIGGTSGSGGTSGTGGIGGTSGTGGTSGSGGMSGSGGGTAVECPGLTPLEGTSCLGVGQCVMESSGLPGCRTVFECFERRWVKVFDNGCVGPSIDLCPLTAEEAEGQPCLDFACVYPNAIVCACERPCSGIQPDPELLVTVCQPAPRAVCVTPKQAGDACAPVGDTCSPECCGTAWTCGPSGWQASEVFCPP